MQLITVSNYSLSVPIFYFHICVSNLFFETWETLHSYRRFWSFRLSIDRVKPVQIARRII